jgi:hypothetical protein
MIADRAASKSTPSQRFGTLAHAALLEPVELARHLAVLDGAAKRGAEYKLAAMCAAIRADKDARWILGQVSHTEHAIEWTDADYGLAKARLDGCGAGMILEYKTARSVGKRALCGAAFASGYHIGAAWYWHGYGRPEAVYIIVQQSVEPYSVVSYLVPLAVLQSAYDEAREIAVRYRIAERSGVFPGPYTGIQTFELPAWATDSEVDVSTGEGEEL